MARSIASPPLTPKTVVLISPGINSASFAARAARCSLIR
jgi:hypothetical protein